jgi:alpha-L-fucosidase 2
MLMQSADGAIFLLPALPDVWQAQGRISGLRARGGFEIVDLEWKDGKVVKAVIKSSIGGNLRIRVANKMTLDRGEALTAATGANANLFFQTEGTPTPIVSSLVTVQLQALKDTFLYDIKTSKEKTYTLVASK